MGTAVILEIRIANDKVTYTHSAFDTIEYQAEGNRVFIWRINNTDYNVGIGHTVHHTMYGIGETPSEGRLDNLWVDINHSELSLLHRNLEDLTEEIMGIDHEDTFIGNVDTIAACIDDPHFVWIYGTLGYSHAEFEQWLSQLREIIAFAQHYELETLKFIA